MRHLIAKRQIEGTARIRPHGVAPGSVAISPSDATHAVVIDRLEESTKDADHYITRAVANHERLRENLEQLSRDLKEVCMERELWRTEADMLYRKRRNLTRRELSCRIHDANASLSRVC